MFLFVRLMDLSGFSPVSHSDIRGVELEKITIIGLGLLGGSIAMALKERKDTEAEIVGYSKRPETVNRAKERGIIDTSAANLEGAVKVADLVIITTPVLAIEEVLKTVSRHLPSGCIVTDTGSTKVKVMEWANEYLQSNVSFIGGHPMAGKETSGLDGADAALFNNCVYCLTPAPNATEKSTQRIVEMVETIGAKPMFIEAKEHDKLVAGISHLPMLISSAFVSATTGHSDWPDMSRIAAGGYRDMSRLASGSPEMNKDIFVTNSAEIIRWLDLYIEELNKYRQLLRDRGERLKDLLEYAREAREKWLKENNR